LLFVPALCIAVAIKVTSQGPVLYWSPRVGQFNRTFSMPKFRTMRCDTPLLPTHLMHNAAAYLTPTGAFLRKTSLDEIPQLWSILRGDMSFVGPRPAAVVQDDLVAMRTQSGVHELLPGLTGWAQVNGRDEIPCAQKAAYDAEYLRRRSFAMDMHILWRTFFKVIRQDDVKH
jgi:O-antigen biosynthesis protein WbqP